MENRNRVKGSVSLNFHIDEQLISKCYKDIKRKIILISKLLKFQVKYGIILSQNLRLYSLSFRKHKILIQIQILEHSFPRIFWTCKFNLYSEVKSYVSGFQSMDRLWAEKSVSIEGRKVCISSILIFPYLNSTHRS